MTVADVTRVGCPCCGKGLGVRPAQFGRPLRCPTCRTSFVPVHWGGIRVWRWWIMAGLAFAILVGLALLRSGGR